MLKPPEPALRGLTVATNAPGLQPRSGAAVVRRLNKLLPPRLRNGPLGGINAGATRIRTAVIPETQSLGAQAAPAPAALIMCSYSIQSNNAALHVSMAATCVAAAKAELPQSRCLILMKMKHFHFST